jgi:hypothetical protein
MIAIEHLHEHMSALTLFLLFACLRAERELMLIKLRIAWLCLKFCMRICLPLPSYLLLAERELMLIKLRASWLAVNFLMLHSVRICMAVPEHLHLSAFTLTLLPVAYRVQRVS